MWMDWIQYDWKSIQYRQHTEQGVTMWELKEKTASWKPTKGALEETRLANTLILDFNLQNCENRFVLFNPPSNSSTLI